MFERAEKLGMTVEELQTRMAYRELVAWQQLDVIRSDERKKAEREAQRKASRRRR